MIERSAMHAGNEEVRVAIVVIVADGRAHVVSRAGQARFFGDVLEHSFAFIAEQAIGKLGGIFLQCGHVRAIGEKNIRPTVLVVVENGRSSSHGRRGVRA